MDTDVQPPPSIVGSSPVVATARTKRLWDTAAPPNPIVRAAAPVAVVFRTNPIAPASGAPLLVEVVDDTGVPDVLVVEAPTEPELVLVLVLDVLPTSDGGSVSSAPKLPHAAKATSAPTYTRCRIHERYAASGALQNAGEPYENGSKRRAEALKALFERALSL
ncbi:MAG: hypothetical protein KIT84_13765 [Labilithrix sp.]|nr:hypothetical protein [Labilithrix sp.]MCW5812086.1 hypothetical protein [Labilithrix sp.]